MYNNASTTTVAYMNKTICNSIPIIVPPIVLQEEFARIVSKTVELKVKYQSSMQELENLFASFSQKVFKGELDLSNVIIDREQIEKEEQNQYNNKEYGDPYDCDEETAKKAGVLF